MPNTPALLQSGATALWRNENVTDAQKDLAETILRAVGLALWVESEDLMDTVTALSGSGPAYFLLVMEALQEAGQSAWDCQKKPQNYSLCRPHSALPKWRWRAARIPPFFVSA